MKPALARRRRAIALAACAVGLVIGTSACRMENPCQGLTVPTVSDNPAGNGK